MREIVKKILNLINVHPDNNQIWILTSLFLSGLLITYVHPAIVKEVYTSLPAEWIAFESLSSSVAGIVCIVGFASALLFMPSLKLALFLWGLCCILDDIGWIIVYIKNKKVLKSIE